MSVEFLEQLQSNVVAFPVNGKKVLTRITADFPNLIISIRNTPNSNGEYVEGYNPLYPGAARTGDDRIPIPIFAPGFTIPNTYSRPV
jgi:hypothetical protein